MSKSGIFNDKFSLSAAIPGSSFLRKPVLSNQNHKLSTLPVIVVASMGIHSIGILQGRIGFKRIQFLYKIGHLAKIVVQNHGRL